MFSILADIIVLMSVIYAYYRQHHHWFTPKLISIMFVLFYCVIWLYLRLFKTFLRVEY